MNSKIKKGIEEKLPRMRAIGNRWIRHALNCAPADRSRAEQGVTEAYRNAGLSTPHIVWCGSPLSGALAIKAMGQMLKKTKGGTQSYRRKNKRKSWEDYTWDTVMKCATKEVEESVMESAVEIVTRSVMLNGRWGWEDAMKSMVYRIWDRGIKGVECSVKNRVSDGVWRGVRDGVGFRMGYTVWFHVGKKVGESVNAVVLDSLSNGVKRRLKRMVVEFPVDGVLEVGEWDNIRDRWRDIINVETGSVFPALNTQREWGVLANYNYFNTVLGLQQETKQLSCLVAIAQSAGWFWPLDEICLICERPATIHLDKNKRIHNTNGPAISFRDGWKIYAHHGVTLPDWIVEESQKITPSKIDEERNVEIRRVMIEKFGQERYSNEREAELIAMDAFGRLWKREPWLDEPIVMVQLLNSTPEHDGSMSVREAITAFGEDAQVNHDGMMMRLGGVPDALRFKSYYLRVPPTCRTPKEAVAWTFGKMEDEYDLATQS